MSLHITKKPWDSRIGREAIRLSGEWGRAKSTSGATAVARPTISGFCVTQVPASPRLPFMSLQCYVEWNFRLVVQNFPPLISFPPDTSSLPSVVIGSLMWSFANTPYHANRPPGRSRHETLFTLSPLSPPSFLLLSFWAPLSWQGTLGTPVPCLPPFLRNCATCRTQLLPTNWCHTLLWVVSSLTLEWVAAEWQ